MKKGQRNRKQMSNNLFLRWIFWVDFPSVIVIIICTKIYIAFQICSFFGVQIIKILYRIIVKLKQENMSKWKNLSKL